MPELGPPYMTPPPESGRWQGKEALYSQPEHDMSGNLPAQPRGLPVNATGESSNTPWRITQGD